MNIVIATRLVAGFPRSIVFVVPDTVTADDVRSHVPVKLGWSLATITGDCLEVVASAKAVAKILKKESS